MNEDLGRWCEAVPSYMRQDDATPVEPWFDFNRSRLWWRFWNLKIIIFRQIFFKKAVEGRRGTVTAPIDDVEEQCTAIALSAASATIASVEQYLEHNDATTLVTWYSIYFSFHASLVVCLAIIGDSESLESSKRYEELNSVRYIFRTKFANNELAARCADILNIIVPEEFTTASNWHNVPLDHAFLDFSTSSEAGTNIFGGFGLSEFDYVPE